MPGGLACWFWDWKQERPLVGLILSFVKKAICYSFFPINEELSLDFCNSLLLFHVHILHHSSVFLGLFVTVFITAACGRKQPT